MKKRHIVYFIALLCLVSYSDAQIRLKRKAEKKADQVIDNLLFGKKKKQQQSTTPTTPTTPTGMPENSSGGDNSVDDYTPKEVDWSGINLGETIHFSTLINMLPERTQGFTRSQKPEGAMYSTQGFKYSMGEKTYEKDGRQLTITLADYRGSEFLVGAQTQQMEYESTDGFAKSVESNGMQGWISIEYDDNQGNMVMTKKQRILVSIDTNGTNEGELKAIFDDLNLSRLNID